MDYDYKFSQCHLCGDEIVWGFIYYRLNGESLCFCSQVCLEEFIILNGQYKSVERQKEGEQDGNKN